MKNLELGFDKGYEEIVIDKDKNKTIKIFLNDLNIIERISNAQKVIEEKMSKEIDYEDKTNDNVNKILELDKVIKEQVDYIFDTNVSEIVFGNKSPMSTINGEFLIVIFLEKIIPIIKENIEKEQIKSQKNIEKYTKEMSNFK